MSCRMRYGAWKEDEGGKTLRDEKVSSWVEGVAEYERAACTRENGRR